VKSRGQSLVEFALIAPLVLLLLLLVMDFGRGIFYYSQMATAAREGARQAVLQYNQFSNTLPPTGCVSPCQVPGVLPQIRKLAGFGISVYYADSSSTASPPSYAASYTPNASTDLPGTIQLAPTAQVNTAYVFIYQLNPADGSVIWSCPCSSPVRTGRHQKIVVDLKLKFQPVTLAYSGLGSSFTMDAQSVQRLEWL
jgi:hypothetical protein